MSDVQRERDNRSSSFPDALTHGTPCVVVSVSLENSFTFVYSLRVNACLGMSSVTQESGFSPSTLWVLGTTLTQVVRLATEHTRTSSELSHPLSVQLLRSKKFHYAR